MKRRYIILVILFFLGLTLAYVLRAHEVRNELTDIDREYIPRFTEGIEPASPDSEYAQQIDFIKRVVDSVLTIAPVNQGISRGAEREPRDLYEARVGLCFDRSRAIEKVLRYHGFQTRHVFLLSVRDTGFLGSLITREQPSHAFTEVLTSRGWMAVDSNTRWVGLTAIGEPVSVSHLKKAVDGNQTIEWETTPPEIFSGIAPWEEIYGLYSRHGEFYPPYDFIPDVNYSEFFENFY